MKKKKKNQTEHHIHQKPIKKNQPAWPCCRMNNQQQTSQAAAEYKRS
jgi:hypothetical protein